MQVHGRTISLAKPGRKARLPSPNPHRPTLHRVHAFHAPSPVQRNTEFGYSRKDVMLIGGGLTGAGFALYYGLQVGAATAAPLLFWHVQGPAGRLRRHRCQWPGLFCFLRSPPPVLLVI